MQVPRIEANLEISGSDALTPIRARGTCMVSENSCQEFVEPTDGERRAASAGYSRRDSCSTLLMMALTRSELLRMISVKRRSSGAR